MGLSSSKPIQISLSDITEKPDVIQVVVVVKPLYDKERQEYSGEDFDIID